MRRCYRRRRLRTTRPSIDVWARRTLSCEGMVGDINLADCNSDRQAHQPSLQLWCVLKTATTTAECLQSAYFAYGELAKGMVDHEWVFADL